MDLNMKPFTCLGRAPILARVSDHLLVSLISCVIRVSSMRSINHLQSVKRGRTIDMMLAGYRYCEAGRPLAVLVVSLTLGPIVQLPD
ncbi:unnamed protein product [Ilex paraguariensis]|uniref:Uncharacterized protein n=1 Tax=Ilex paraguariensis TaxID=185542 RepID=A0ABC8SPN8_9AQUA